MIMSWLLRPMVRDVGLPAVVNPDVILLDVMLPDVDGFELCHRLKTDERWQHIPIILVTALEGQEDLMHVLRPGERLFAQTGQ